MEKLTRDQAIAAVGIETVLAVEARNCEPTSRVYDHEDGEIEWSASVEIYYDWLTAEQVAKLPMSGASLEAVYYTTAKDAELVEANGGDWGAVSWSIDHYRII